MSWRKLGCVWRPAGHEQWRRSHAFCPTSVALDDRLRVFCASRDGDNVGRLGWVDVQVDDPTHVLGVSPGPVLDVGRDGAFDESGVNPLCLCELPDGRLRLYYTGWQLGHRIRYYLFTGVAESSDRGASFQRVTEAPVLDRSDGELFVRVAGHVRAGGQGWRMWYSGGDGWVTSGGIARPSYALRYVESADGITWPRRGEICIAPEGPDEHGFGRAGVLVTGGLMRMWYSVRYLSRGYRIGYAESRDGLSWDRRDGDAGIDVSRSGWDSEMICMGWVQETPAATYLFYNGNGYGETGFGVAVLEE